MGRGRLGRGLATSLGATRIDTALTSGHRPQPAVLDADVVVFAVPDPYIAEVAAATRSHLRSKSAALHCSGSLGPDALASLRNEGMEVGVMHPLVSFARPDRPPCLTGTTFVIDGDPRALRAARRIVQALGARPVAASVHGAGYHAAAALSANGAAALAAVAVRVCQTLGLSRRDAERAIGALLRTVGENVERIGVPDALSGPMVRGDHLTVEKHRRALGSLDRDALDAYDGVAPAILDCAHRAGLADETVERIRSALKKRVRKLR